MSSFVIRKCYISYTGFCDWGELDREILQSKINHIIDTMILLFCFPKLNLFETSFKSVENIRRWRLWEDNRSVRSVCTYIISLLQKSPGKVFSFTTEVKAKCYLWTRVRFPCDANQPVLIYGASSAWNVAIDLDYSPNTWLAWRLWPLLPWAPSICSN